MTLNKKRKINVDDAKLCCLKKGQRRNVLENEMTFAFVVNVPIFSASFSR